MSRRAEQDFTRHKLTERRNIDANEEGGATWLRSRLDEVRAMKSRANADEWVQWHAAECALLEEVATRQNRGRR